MMPVGAYASIIVKSGKATGTTKNANKAKPKRTTKSASTPKATARVRKTKAIPDIDFDEIYCSALSRNGRTSQLQPLPLPLVVDRVHNTLAGYVGEATSEGLVGIVTSADDPYSEQVLAELTSRFVAEDLLSPAATRYLAYAWIAYALARQAHARGDDAVAWYHISDARYYQGQTDGDYVALRTSNRAKAAGQSGGKKTALKRSPLMRECIRQLTLRRPKRGGWKSSSAAFETIAPRLLQFCDESGEALPENKLKSRVLRWLATREDFQRAYAGDEQAN